MTHAEIVERVRRTLAQSAPNLGAETLAEDAPLGDSGAFDSIALVKTALFLESAFDIRVKPADLSGAPFRSLAAIVRLVESRRAPR